METKSESSGAIENHSMDEEPLYTPQFSKCNASSFMAIQTVAKNNAIRNIRKLRLAMLCEAVNVPRSRDYDKGDIFVNVPDAHMHC